LITRAALPFLAILVLQATPGQIAALRIAEVLPGFLVGLVAGVWLDRLHRRPVMILADLGRAAALGLVPALALTDHLGLAVLYLIAIAASVLTVFFEVAEQSFIPSVVERTQLVDANSRMTASQSVAEISAFGVVGWLVQFFTAPVAIAVDAVTFLVSAVLVGMIRSPERTQGRPIESSSVWREMFDGVRALNAEPSLQKMAISFASMSLAYGLIGTVYALYGLRELGFQPGPLGLTYAVGGVSSLAASVFAGRINARFGAGRVMVVGLALGGLGTLFLPLASGAGVFAFLLLVGQQLVGDGGLTVYGINLVSLRQAIAPAALLARINAGTRVAGVGATLAGTLLAGVLAQTIGYRPTLVIAAVAMLAGALVLLRSPVALARAA
jgi:MFS family permease